MNHEPPRSDDRHRVLRVIRDRREVSLSDRTHALWAENLGLARWTPGLVSFEITSLGASILQLWDYRKRQAEAVAAPAAAELAR